MIPSSLDDVELHAAPHVTFITTCATGQTANSLFTCLGSCVLWRQVLSLDHLAVVPYVSPTLFNP